ncbi:Putative ribonuclease H protein [Dendrobium catenatum]|uniref:Ribonuclease H protein n=1 Tax=Dendrobium catenatum TaxID=906689 RepID=A0A2I0WKG4_9ASPA|nr:Putative ribonuclease H protein [Dendrobium catenatum]
MHGEDDLKFLYARIKKRRNHSCTLIASDEPNVRQDKINSIIQHFEKLFNSPQPASICDHHLIPKGNSIPPHLSDLLTMMVTDAEIKDVVFMGCSTSSPGPNGFNFEFYKSSWLLIGPLVCKAVKSFFSKGYLPNIAKATAITLIPKSAHASNISDFRPIALCNVFYKIISKILASRMKEIMPLIIGENQAGFIKDRISSDNILLASEILKDFKKSAKKNILCAKLDIRKAFDSVSREFILLRKGQKGFPPKFIHWIRACISNVHFSICIDGALEGFFASSSGIRQGCPLSPYLFCIAMDAFTCLIDNKYSHDRYIGIQMNDIKLSHLLYADDLLIFGEASSHNCTVLMKNLDFFANVTGLKVNHEKSKLIISNYISDHTVVCEALNISTCCEKMIYLGLPISVKKPCKFDFQPLMNSITDHLAGWKARLLSMAGRLQFLKYTVCNTIAYWIRGAIIPKTCLKRLSRICAKFLFFGDLEAKKLHLIAWKNTCKPKMNGGLGIPDLLGLQFANLCSLIFRIHDTKTPLSSFLMAKYGSLWQPPLSLASPLWKETGEVVSKISSTIRLDSNTLYWSDKVKPCFSSFLKFYYKEADIVDWHHLVWHKHYALKYSIYSWISIRGDLKQRRNLLREI